MVSMRSSAFIGILVLVGLSLGSCGPQPANPSAAPASTVTRVATPVPSATPLPSATPTAAQGGIPISAPPIRFVIPAGLSTGADVQAIAAVAAGETSRAVPAHLEVNVHGAGPVIYVFPAREYASVDDAADYNIKLLQAILAGKASPSNEDNVPRIPDTHGGLVFAAQVKILQFGGGSGLRAVTQYASDVRPVNNAQLLYQYTGLTGDGKYYLIAVANTSLPFLAADADSPVPSGGIPFPQDLSGPSYQEYMKQVTGRIDNSPANQFDPSMDVLDALIQSISIQ
jgi:hypothetical protein